MIIYKTTNLINGLIYIGYDSVDNPEYLGSSAALMCDIIKQGKSTFRKATIDVYETLYERRLKEQYWIAFYNARDPNVGYNIHNHKGGCGGNSGARRPHDNSRQMSTEQFNYLAQLWKKRKYEPAFLYS